MNSLAMIDDKGMYFRRCVRLLSLFIRNLPVDPPGTARVETLQDSDANYDVMTNKTTA